MQQLTYRICLVNSLGDKMRKVIMTVTVLVLAASPLVAQYDHHSGSIGIGGQAVFPAIGASIIVDAHETIGLQGILGVFGDLKIYGGRVIYRFTEFESVRPYAYGLVAGWSHRGYAEDLSKRKTEIVPGYGVGGGIEFSKPERIPGAVFSAEIGYGTVKFKDVDYDFAAITYGVGIHFFFN